ncbi:MAG: hypothetical protein PHG00_03555 [Methylococcales bacterium]|nr:hypothetical protein [Methylococcales bacterium]
MILTKPITLHEASNTQSQFIRYFMVGGVLPLSLTLAFYFY